MCDFEFQNEPYLQYEEGATFVRRCEKCYRFVKADEIIKFMVESGQPKDPSNATCSKCGRTKMLFIGYM